MPWKIMAKTSVLKLSSKPKISHVTIDFKVVGIVVKFDPSSFTYVIFYNLNPY